MGKSKKKRTKRYSGEDATSSPVSEPVVYRVTAVDRGRLGQWWFEKKKVVKPIAIVAGIVVVIIWLIVELVRIAV